MMKNRSLLLVSAVILTLALASCEMPTEANEEASVATPEAVDALAKRSSVNGAVEKATGEVWARWGEGCEHEGEGGGHGGGGHADDGHNEGGCGGSGGAHPARDFYLQFNAHNTTPAKGAAVLNGVDAYEGIWINGTVTWFQPGDAKNEVFFGGKITAGSVERGCFLIGVQDNGEGANAFPDRIHYRLYGSLKSSCSHQPDHLPLGFPAVTHEGNLQVHVK